ncbi:MAG: hypothetical protein BKP49_00120 [Treponema sp. CETP13]|nr:MAG: hypothetical protein BKP49_00120 [Treponema sp. CETP13]
MGTCKHCGITIHDNIKVCPICSHSLEMDGTEENTYPEIFEKLRKKNLSMRIAIAATLVSCILIIILDYHFSAHLDWSVVGIATLIFAAHTMYSFLYQKRRLFSIISGLLFRLAILFIIVDYVIGFYNWSLNYALPGLFILENINLICFVFLDKKNRKSYVYYDIWIVLSNILLLILEAIELIQLKFFVTISIQTSIVVFLCLLIIGGLSARKEFARRWHIRKK